MALFALWQDGAAAPAPAELLHRRLAEEAHAVPQVTIARTIDTAAGPWHLAAFATATRFYAPEAQVWIDAAAGACVIHGLLWRQTGDRAERLDAAAVATLLDRPGARLPDNVAGEYVVARLHPCGTLDAFTDPAGVHQLFRREDRPAMIASRAAFLALLADDWTPETESALWLSSVGYRIGSATGWRGVRQLSPSLPTFSGARGFDQGGAALLDEGLAQACTAIRLAAGEGPLDLPITGGKDSRVILAIALAAGLGDRLTLFTRGPEGHPDVTVGRMLAEQTGLPHRRKPPRAESEHPDRDIAAFRTTLARIAYQGDGGMGGWDLISRSATGTGTLITGHMGEVLKAYAKGGAGEAPLDPIALVRLQSPFDPIGLLRAEARDHLTDILATQMAEARSAGAEETDLPDLFYLRNRVPNWLGGIRAVQSFEQQPVMPLGVPALQRLAFRLTAEERRQERLHYAILERLAPELIAIPFAHQRWHPALGAPPVDPVIAPAGLPLFGNWQYALNRDTRIRAHLSECFAGLDIPLWEGIDRAALLTALRETPFDVAGCVSMLGLTVGALHQAGLIWPDKLGAKADPHVFESAPLRRPIAEAMRQSPRPIAPVPLSGYVDGASGAAALPAPGRLRRTGDGGVAIGGWLYAPEWPGAQPGIEARIDGIAVATATAGGERPDLRAAGIGHGAYGFTLHLDAAMLRAGATLEIGGVNGAVFPEGRLEIEA